LPSLAIIFNPNLIFNHILPFFRIRYGGPNAYSWRWLNGYTAAAHKFYGWLRLMNITAAYGGLQRRLGVYIHSTSTRQTEA